MTTAPAGWDGLEEPWRRCLTLAWESCRAGSLGIGAVVTDASGDVTATGRNRLLEENGGDDALAATPLAHAEMNALAKLRWGTDHGEHVLWTSLEPCLLCASGIRLANIGTVRYLGPDPIWEGIDRLPELTPHLAGQWPAIERPRSDAFAVFGALLPMHAAAFWLGGEGLPPVWAERTPTIAGLACDLARSRALVDLAGDHAEVTDVLDALWDRLDTAAADLARAAL